MLASAVQNLSRLLPAHGVNAPNHTDDDDDELSVIFNALNTHLETKTTGWSSQRSRLEADLRAAQDDHRPIRLHILHPPHLLRLRLNHPHLHNNTHNRLRPNYRPVRTTHHLYPPAALHHPALPEARSAKFGSGARSFRTGSPMPASPGSSGANANGGAARTVPGTPGAVVASSDLDVRALKTLYTGAASNAGGGTAPLSPRTASSNGLPPNTPNNTTTNGTTQTQQPFSVQAFAQRVQALIADDKALIERLMRFAQAHDLLKKNAGRAQKLAQDGTHALETYQKQVRVLEERCWGWGGEGGCATRRSRPPARHIEHLIDEKRVLERLTTVQAKDCAQLTESNNTLSNALTLAEEAAQASDLSFRLLSRHTHHISSTNGHPSYMYTGMLRHHLNHCLNHIILSQYLIMSCLSLPLVLSIFPLVRPICNLQVCMEVVWRLVLLLLFPLVLFFYLCLRPLFECLIPATGLHIV